MWDNNRDRDVVLSGGQDGFVLWVEIDHSNVYVYQQHFLLMVFINEQGEEQQVKLF